MVAVSESWLKGRLLVATPALGDPNFHRTVILVIEHGEDGAVGVVLNRPTEMELSDPLPLWESLAAHPPVVFKGGPVAPNVAICLGRARTATIIPGFDGDGDEDDGEVWQPLFGPLGALDLSGDPDDIADQGVERIRVFSGYAGWGEGQLEDEIDEGAWFVVDALPDDALSADPDELWHTVLRRQPGRLSLFGNFPPDPSMN